MVSHDRVENSLSGARAGIIVNLFLAVLKAGAGIMSGSFAMMADALHSFADIVASGVVYVGIRVASKPADDEHPYGHGKAESIASKIVSIIVILAGLNIGYFSLQALFQADLPVPGQMALYAALISIVVKETLFRYTIRIGRETNCKALVANAFEHRTDALSSVAALLGIGGALLGAAYGLPQLAYLDPVAGIIVSVFIVRMGWHIAIEAASELMDAQEDPEFIAGLEKLILAVDGVLEVHGIRVRAAGPHKFVDLEIGVDGDISVREGHDVARRVKQELLAKQEEITNVLIHVNPCRACEEKRDFDRV
ncbi:cation diffusion facilitator family transporter [Dethiobacter alkaliphilus]|uniref:Cation diffusion facilitator family transporter n=1 Tax=Dethiobacter alkaliphilus AHT 1 TaxID=555088 RepID=C0GFY4_DETAL|nr:cation diffusion facilitator family transporter [Dethiobacter alkaliphilus]EEG77673.1 cation diffusion facilitator family transporter [Dethiobacter alkaliphilus AHT 1]